VLPVSHELNARAIRADVERAAQRLDSELGDERDKFASRITFAGMDALNATMPIVLRLRRSAPSLLHLKDRDIHSAFRDS
jgi:hypothetical protein